MLELTDDQKQTIKEYIEEFKIQEDHLSHFSTLESQHRIPQNQRYLTCDGDA
jgi:hypothetical protein